LFATIRSQSHPQRATAATGIRAPNEAMSDEAPTRADRLQACLNWLALATLLALGIVWDMGLPLS